MGIPLTSYKKTCKYCKKEFTTIFVRSKFCSPECAYRDKRIKVLLRRKNNPEEHKRRLIKYRENRAKKHNIVLLKNRIYECAICKKSFVPKNNPTKKYCSKTCKQKADTIRHAEHGKNPMVRKRRNQNWNKNYRIKLGYEPKQEVKCIICNNVFMRDSIDQKLCSSSECRTLFYRTKGREKYYRDKDKILERRKNNLQFLIKNKLSSRINCAVKSQNTKKHKITIELIGCSISFLKEYLEKQFDKNMSWKNYGKKGWHIDHIIPCATFNLIEEEQQNLCFHYTNLQPLWGTDNYKKSCRVDELDC